MIYYLQALLPTVISIIVLSFILFKQYQLYKKIKNE